MKITGRLNKCYILYYHTSNTVVMPYKMHICNNALVCYKGHNVCKLPMQMDKEKL